MACYDYAEFVRRQAREDHERSSNRSSVAHDAERRQLGQDHILHDTYVRERLRLQRTQRKP